MTGPPGSPPAEGGGAYVRGGGGVTVDQRRVWLVGLAVVLAALTALAALLAVDAVGERSRTGDLRAHGVSIPATVTRCVGLASGTGITVSAYRCRGSYTLGGQTHEAVLLGNRALLAPGVVVDAVVLPRHPQTLTLASSLRRHRSWTPFVTPAVLFVLVIVGVAVVWTLTHNRYRRAKAQ